MGCYVGHEDVRGRHAETASDDVMTFGVAGRLDRLTAFVTGASGGIGRAIAIGPADDAAFGELVDPEEVAGTAAYLAADTAATSPSRTSRRRRHRPVPIRAHRDRAKD